MKITLISLYPNIQTFGVRTLSSCLKRNNHDSEVIFLRREFTDRYEDITLNEVVGLSRSSGLIGISLMTNFFDNAVQVTQKLKENLKVPILWGGIHPTVRPEECLDYADMVCIGEGEDTLVELANRMEKGEDFSGVPGLWLKNRGGIVKNQFRRPVQDLDSIPFPDYSCESHYVLNKRQVIRMEKMVLKRYLGDVYMTMPTRGCPFGCAYCCNNTLNEMFPHQRFLRKRSIDNIIAELLEARGKLPFIGHVKFEDDAFFMYTKEEMSRFCQEYKKHINLPLVVGGGSPLTIDREKLSLLIDAGLECVRMGIQTGNDQMKKLYRRFYTNKQVESTARVINGFKDKIRMPQYDIILDNPWECEEDLIETLRFLVKLPVPYCLALYSLTFYPGTEIYSMAVKGGLIYDDLNEVYRKPYYNFRKTYLNSLFLLLNEYAQTGSRISPQAMFLMTEDKFRQLKLSQLLYAILKIWILFYGRIYRIYYLFYNALKDLKRGNWTRITCYVIRRVEY